MIDIETNSGKSIRLDHGGARLEINGVPQQLSANGEYRSIYRDFAEVVTRRRSKIDRSRCVSLPTVFWLGNEKWVKILFKIRDNADRNRLYACRWRVGGQLGD